MLPLVLAFFLQAEPPPRQPMAEAKPDYSQPIKDLTKAIESIKPRDYSNELSNLNTAITRLEKQERWLDPSVIVSGVSTFILLCTVWLTWNMQRAAQTQAEASIKMLEKSEVTQRQAEEMLVEARRQTILQVRPILVLERMSGDNKIKLIPSSTSLDFVLKNVGCGPALKVVQMVHPLSKSSNRSPEDWINYVGDRSFEGPALAAGTQQSVKWTIENCCVGYSCTNSDELWNLLNDHHVFGLNIAVAFEDMFHNGWRIHYSILAETEINQFTLSCDELLDLGPSPNTRKLYKSC